VLSISSKHKIDSENFQRGKRLSYENSDLHSVLGVLDHEKLAWEEVTDLILQSSVAPIFAFDLQGFITMWSRGMTAHTTLAESSAVGQHMSELAFDVLSQRQLIDVIRSASTDMVGGKVYTDVVLRLTANDEDDITASSASESESASSLNSPSSIRLVCTCVFRRDATMNVVGVICTGIVVGRKLELPACCPEMKGCDDDVLLLDQGSHDFEGRPHGVSSLPFTGCDSDENQIEMINQTDEPPLHKQRGSGGSQSDDHNTNGMERSNNHSSTTRSRSYEKTATITKSMPLKQLWNALDADEDSSDVQNDRFLQSSVTSEKPIHFLHESKCTTVVLCDRSNLPGTSVVADDGISGTFGSSSNTACSHGNSSDYSRDGENSTPSLNHSDVGPKNYKLTRRNER